MSIGWAALFGIVVPVYEGNVQQGHRKGSFVGPSRFGYERQCRDCQSGERSVMSVMDGPGVVGLIVGGLLRLVCLGVVARG